VGDGQLAGKVIVVDAGHGGHDSGTKALTDGLEEKAITLPIAKMLAADLAAQGATVIMTRQTDVFIPLQERAAIANRNHADLFLCVHINSNGRNTSTSGSITFYHNADPISSTLADCIERQLPAAGGIPGIGTWSDTKIYGIGFSVLRNIKMPGVLMELGFMNNANDRPKLVNKDAQQAMAAAIVKGVKVYLGQPSDNEN
jgi:N-acetylmuramoyl-L-alanine amidase